jgi:hypothetical protein
MAHRFEHPPYLTVPPFPNRDLQHALARTWLRAALT